MASQYRKIEDFPGIYWEKDSPVALENMRLVRDTYRGVNVLQLNFRNVSDSNLYGLSISISMKDFNGKRVLRKDIEYNYYGIEVGLNKTFGSDEYIPVEPEAKSFLITVTRAEFSEGAMFRGAVLLKLMPEAPELESLGEFQEPFTEQLLSLRPKLKILCAPEDKLFYWRCTCKRFYPHTVHRCPACNIRKDELLNILKELKAKKRELEKAAALAEKERLEAEERARLEAEEKRRLEEEAEQQRLAEEAERKRLRNQKIKKCCAYATTIVALLLLLLLIAPRFKNILMTIQPEIPTEEQQPTSEATPEPTPEPTPTPTPTPAPESTPEPTPEVFKATPLAVLGQDLKETDLKLVLRLIGMEYADFENFDVIYVSSEDESSYLSGRYDESLLGGRSLSSLLITPTEPGSGLHITTYNITYCTEEMYQEMLLESGITDADVVVAGPHKMSGTAALAGIMKAGEYLKEQSTTAE